MSRIVREAARGLWRLAAWLALAGGAAAAPAAQAGALTVYGALGYDHALAQAFTRASGIEVELVHLSTGPLLARVQAEAAHPQWDLVWFDGNVSMSELAREGRLACGWEPRVPYTPAGRGLRPADGCYVPVGMTYSGVMLVATRRVSDAQRPRTWKDLAAPALRARVGMNNPAISGPTYPFVAGMLQSFGEAGGRHYFETLVRNGLKVFPTNSVTLRALQYGQINVAVVQSSAAVSFAGRYPGYAVVAAPPSTELPSDIAIRAHLAPATLREARRFVRFVLSPAGQRILQSADPAGDSNYAPLLEGVRPPASLARLGEVQPLVLDPVKWGPREPGVVAWFTAHVAR